LAARRPFWFQPRSRHPYGNCISLQLDGLPPPNGSTAVVDTDELGTSFALEMKILRISLILIGAAAALTIGLSVYGKRGVNVLYARVDLDGYTKPMTVAVTVFDENGAPVSGAAIESKSHSGTSRPELTDSTGFAAIEPGEAEVLALLVSGVEVWSTPYKDGLLGAFCLPSCADGLSFTVKLKAAQVGPPNP